MTAVRSRLLISVAFLLTCSCTESNPRPSEPVSATEPAEQERHWNEQLQRVREGKQQTIRVSRDVITDEQWQTLAQDATSLEVLDVEQLEINDSAYELLTHLAKLRQLRIGSAVGDEALEHFSQVNSLHVLNLPHGTFTDAGLKTLAKHPELELLRFHSPHVTDEGLSHIARLPSLRFLHLIRVPITDAGLNHLEGLDQLESLYLDGCNCTDDGILQLLEALPQLHLHRDQLHIENDPHAHEH